MPNQKLLRIAAASAAGAGLVWAIKPRKQQGRQDGLTTSVRLAMGAAAGSVLSFAADVVGQKIKLWKS